MRPLVDSYQGTHTSRVFRSAVRGVGVSNQAPFEAVNAVANRRAKQPPRRLLYNSLYAIFPPILL